MLSFITYYTKLNNVGINPLDMRTHLQVPGRRLSNSRGKTALSFCKTRNFCLRMNLMPKSKETKQF